MPYPLARPDGVQPGLVDGFRVCPTEEGRAIKNLTIVDKDYTGSPSLRSVVVVACGASTQKSFRSVPRMHGIIKIISPR